MSNSVKIETLNVKAKKKKNFIIIGLIGAIFITIITSFLMAFFDSEAKQSFEKREAVEDKKDFEVIKEKDLKQTWAISIENRIEDQNKERIRSQKELAEQTQKSINDVSNLVVESMASLTKKIEKMEASIADRMTDLEASTDAKLNEQGNKIQDLTLMSDNYDNSVEQKDDIIILGPDLLPVLNKGEEPTKGGESSKDVINPKKSVEDVLEQLNPGKTDPIKSSVDIKKEEKVVEKKVVKEPVRKRAVLNTVSIDVSSSVEKIAEEDLEFAQLEELRKIQNNSLHIMTGLTQAYMITGAYAPAFESGKEEPLPVLLQAEGDILIANDDTESIDKCMLIGSAKGNMNSQTADIRLHKINCSLAEGTKMIEGEISGWVIGENGIPGVQGELMHKNGAWLSKTFVSGFLETFANAFSSTGSTEINIGGSDDGTSTSQAIRDNLGSSAAGGASTVLNKLGDYYLNMAEQIFPVIEVKGGRTVSIILKGGEDLEIKDFNKVDLSDIEDRIGSERDFIEKVGLKKYKELKSKLDGNNSFEETEAATSSEVQPQPQSTNSIQSQIEPQLNKILEGRN